MNDVRRPGSTTLMTLTVFFVFAATSLLLVLLGARVYKSVSQAMEDNGSLRTAFSYVANKTQTGEWELVQVGETAALLVYEEYESEVFVTCLYPYQGGLYEQFCALGDELKPQHGQLVAQEQTAFEQEGAGVTMVCGRSRMALGGRAK